MKQEMCLVCNDKRKYEMSVSNARRIIFRLTTLVNEYETSNFNREENDLLAQLGMYNKHNHFICGHCMKVNTMELTNLEQKIDYLLVAIAKKIESKNNVYHDTLLLLSGDYSGKYQVFQKYCLKKMSEIK